MHDILKNFKKSKTVSKIRNMYYTVLLNLFSSDRNDHQSRIDKRMQKLHTLNLSETFDGHCTEAPVAFVIHRYY